MTFKIIILIAVSVMCNVLAWADSKQTFDKNVALKILQKEAAQQGYQVQKEKSDFKKWEHGPRSDLYVGVVASESLSNDLMFWIGIFKQTATGPVLVDARADVFEGVDMPWDYSISLDFAPFRLNARETAFGVRYHNYYHSTARSEMSETLYLYRFWDDHLYPIFNVITVEEGSDMDGNHDFSHHLILIMSTKAHNGFFDLVVKDKKTKKTHVSCWNGSAYVDCK